jgi:hypothetical protein
LSLIFKFWLPISSHYLAVNLPGNIPRYNSVRYATSCTTQLAMKALLWARHQ